MFTSDLVASSSIKRIIDPATRLVGVHHGFLKNNWMGSGSDSNIGTAVDPNFSSPHLFNRLREMKPHHFMNDGNFLLVCA